MWNKSPHLILYVLLYSASGCQDAGVPILEEDSAASNPSERQPEPSSTEVLNDTHQSSHSHYEWKDYLKVIEISLRGMDKRQKNFRSLSEIAIWQEEDDLIALLTTPNQETAVFSCHWHSDRLACHFRINPSVERPWDRSKSTQEESLPHLPLD